MRNLELDALFGEERKSVSFHDSKITKIHLDYIKREAVFDCLIYTENEDSINWRSGRLIFDGLLFFVNEIPDENYPYEDEALDISSDGSISEVDFEGLKFPDNLPESAFIHFFYVNNWNRCLFISATEARFDWN